MAGGIHERTANGRKATKIDVQLIGVHQSGEIATKDLTQHAQQHQATRTYAVNGSTEVINKAVARGCE